MNAWTAVIPFRGGFGGKTRLAAGVAPDERRRLSLRLFKHVAEVVRSAHEVSSVAVLSNDRPAGWDGRLIADESRGLNAELASLACGLRSGPLLVIHADLPLLRGGDIVALISASEDGCAIGPDRHGTGTNALALRDPSGFAFAFGEDSFTRHLAAAGGRARVVRRIGLGLDIDTPEDLRAAIAAGFSPD